MLKAVASNAGVPMQTVASPDVLARAEKNRALAGPV